MRSSIEAAAAAVAVFAVLLGACSGPEEPATTPSDASVSIPDLLGIPTPAPSETGSPVVGFSDRSDGCVTPDREDWRAFMTATGLGDVDGDGEDDFVHHHADRRSRVRGIVETGAGLVPILDSGFESGELTGFPEPGPVVELGSSSLVALELGGAPEIALGFAAIDECRAQLLPVDGQPTGLAYATTGGPDCLPECGVGLTCIGATVRQTRWQVFVRGDDGGEVPWEDVADDPSVRSDDLRVRVTSTDYTLGSNGFRDSGSTSYVTVIDDGRLPQLHDGFVCEGLQLHPFAPELTTFGIDPEVFDQQRDEG